MAMISEESSTQAFPKAVFVLGAGASMPYGLPSGARLRELLCDENTWAASAGNDRHRILSALGYDVDLQRSFRKAIARSWASSVDFFLATNPQYLDLGKAAISILIGEAENDHSLFFAKPHEDWFRYLWRHLRTPSPHEFPKDRIGFVTFNYDRSLEHAFCEGIAHAYPQYRHKSHELMPQIVHVYGSLGPYPNGGLASADCRSYGAKVDLWSVERMKECIAVVSQKDSGSINPSAARTLLSNAGWIVFLGFGFDSESCDLIGVSRNNCCLSDSCKIQATSLGLTEPERSWIMARFPQAVGRNRLEFVPPDRKSLPELDCLGYMKWYSADVMRWTGKGSAWT